MDIYRFKNREIPFVARLVGTGETYGLDFKLKNDSDKIMIEFYDARYKMVQKDGIPLGQFISRYNLDTFFEHNEKLGLYLDSGSPNWSLTGESVGKVKEWAIQTITKKITSELQNNETAKSVHKAPKP